MPNRHLRHKSTIGSAASPNKQQSFSLIEKKVQIINKIMDYTTIPRKLIYKDRDDIDEFNVDCEGGLEYQFFENLLDRSFLKNREDTPYLTLRIFNNAYYICALIYRENHPRQYLAKYLRKAVDGHDKNILWENHVMPTTMALVYSLLLADGIYKKTDKFIMDIWDNFSDWDTKGASEGKEDFYKQLLDGFKLLPDNEDRFEPRNIISAVTDDDVSVYDVAEGIDYVLGEIGCLDEDLIRGTLPWVRKKLNQLDDSSINDVRIAYILEYPISRLKWAYFNSGLKWENGTPHQSEIVFDGSINNASLPQELNDEKIDDDIWSTKKFEAELDRYERSIKNLLTEVEKWKADAERCKGELEAYKERAQNRAGINRLQTAHLGMKLAPKLGINVSNKKDLAPVLSKLFGWGQRSLEQQMCKLLPDEEEMELANIFGDLSPALAKEICKKWEGTPTEESEAPPAE